LKKEKEKSFSPYLNFWSFFVASQLVHCVTAARRGFAVAAAVGAAHS
jgi:hypothetical protein